MMKRVSVKEWFYLLRSLGQDEELLFYPTAINIDRVMEDFVDIRDRWISDGFISLDFDGSIAWENDFYREVYNLTNWKSLTRLETDDGSILFVQGPVDFLKAVRESGIISFESINHTAFHELLNTMLQGGKTSDMITKRHEDGMTVKTDVSKQVYGSDPFKTELDKHMKLIYRKAEDEQPDHSDDRL